MHRSIPLAVRIAEGFAQKETQRIMHAARTDMVVATVGRMPIAAMHRRKR